MRQLVRRMINKMMKDNDHKPSRRNRADTTTRRLVSYILATQVVMKVKCCIRHSQIAAEIEVGVTITCAALSLQQCCIKYTPGQTAWQALHIILDCAE
jgi:hypothetical protein